MNQATSWRLDIAKKMARIYCANPKVQAMVVGGSVARGIADAYSDLDTIAFCSELPSEAELSAAEQQAPGTRWNYNRQSPHAVGVECRIGDARIEVGHLLSSRMESHLADVVDRHQTDTGKQKSVGGMLDALPLYGEDLVRSWQDKAAAYPDGLARAMVEAHLSFMPNWIPRDYAPFRDSPLYRYELFCQATNNILGILLGLNRLYHPHEFKWLDYTVGKMRLAPPHLAQRLKAVFRLAPPEAADHLGRLIEETFALVEAHLPQVDTAPARRVFNFETQYCDEPPEMPPGPSGGEEPK